MNTDLVKKGAAWLTPESPQEEALELLDKLDMLQQEATRAKAAVEESLVDWIQGNGDLYKGNKRYFAGYRTRLKKKTELKDLADAVRDRCMVKAEEEAGEGTDPEDVAALAWRIFVDSLCSNAFLVSSLRKLLDGDFDAYFDSKRVDMLRVVDAKSDEGTAVFERPRRLMSQRVDR